MNEIIVGLDIGATKIGVLVAEVTETDQVLVHGLGTAPSAGLRQGALVDPEATVKAIQEATQEAQQQAHMEIHTAYVGVTGEQVKSSTRRGSLDLDRPGFEIRAADLERVRWAALNGSRGPEQEAVWIRERGFLVDGQGYLLSPVGMCGPKLEVEMFVTLADRGFLNTVRECVKRAGLGVAGVVPEAAAAGEAVTTVAEREVGIAVLDIGAGTSDLVVYAQGQILHAATLPFGGGHVSYDLAWGLSTLYSEAERVKLTSACAIPEQVREGEQVTLTLADGTLHAAERSLVAEIVGARMEEILDLTRREIEGTVPRSKLLAGLALTGGGALLPGAVELAHHVVGLGAHLGLPIRLTGRTEQVYSPLYATTVGLIRCGSQDQQEREQSRQQRSIWGRAWNWWQGGQRWFLSQRPSETVP